ncbi:hypothetical protein POM88_039721 [Heracleum sosnowskyi]|uniref:Uncharacterized protein n=1 Tax=Heracleum sosnowskyi TaxID=360622 RepID=A0AAD8HAV6_9APIA|nr:hypothetical protein POM88_039721 [Heracleum sosnowskyi]
MEKKRVTKHVNECLKCGYSPDAINIKEMLKPHYFSQRAWNSICDHWGTPEFNMKSEKGKKARMMVEFTPRTGAKPFDQRMEEIDAEREANGEMPIPDDEFMGMVYDPTDPVVKDLQEKMIKIRSSQAELDEPTDELQSPRTQREIQRIKDQHVTIQAKPPIRGRVFLRPHETLGEIFGGREATQWISKQAMTPDLVSVPDDIYKMMSTILDQVRQMVRSLPMREVKQSVLDEEVRKLATSKFPDPSQHSLQMHYIRATSGLLHLILEDNDKIIGEATVVDGMKAVMEGGTSKNEDEDQEAFMYPLALA